MTYNILEMSAIHSHGPHPVPVSSRPLQIGLVIVIVIGAAEVIGGILSNSLALLSDAGHMLVDVLALVLALFAAHIARRPVTARRTYGFHRVEIISALANGTILILVSAYILYEAYQRLGNPPEIHTPIMLTIAVIGLIANVAGVLLMRSSSRRNLNIKAAFWHIIGDTISSVGVIVGGIIISVTGSRIVDPIIAIFITAIILWGAVRLVGESADILLEAVPRQIQMDKVIASIKEVPGVEEVHDIHIWTITSGLYALSAHLQIHDQMVSRSTEIVATVNEGLAHDYEIRHTTLQLECETCPSGCVCDISTPAHEHLEAAANEPASRPVSEK